MKVENLNVKRIKFRDDITALRALAVISVLLYHAEFQLFKGGWLGVDIFFVISGYLISNIIFSELTNNLFSFNNSLYFNSPRLFFKFLIIVDFVQLYF